MPATGPSEVDGLAKLRPHQLNFSHSYRNGSLRAREPDILEHMLLECYVDDAEREGLCARTRAASTRQ